MEWTLSSDAPIGTVRHTDVITRLRKAIPALFSIGEKAGIETVYGYSRVEGYDPPTIPGFTPNIVNPELIWGLVGKISGFVEIMYYIDLSLLGLPVFETACRQGG